MNINRRADRGRKGKSQRSGKPFGLCAPLRIPLSGIPFSPSLLQAKDDLSINVRKILDTTLFFSPPLTGIDRICRNRPRPPCAPPRNGRLLGVILALKDSFTVILLVCALGYFSAGALFPFTMNRRESAA